MNSKSYVFNGKHLQNIKDIFEEKSGVELTKKRAGFAVHRKLVAAALAVVLCCSIGTPVLAAHVPFVYELMYLVSPNVAQFFMPVQKSNENDGVKMEVVSAYVHGDTAEIYITLKDLTGNRIDETTDLYDSYSINRPFSSSASCERVGYDAESKTATFLITIMEWGDQVIAGDKITFSVREFLSHKSSYQGIEIPIDLSLIQMANDTQQVDLYGGSGPNYQSIKNQKIAAIPPTEPMQEFSVDGINLTGIGYIDGLLHVQTKVSDYLTNDNHGSFYLKDKDGNTINFNYNFYFGDGEAQPRAARYCEYVFDVPQDVIGEYSLMGDFITSGMHTEGYWSVTFPLEKV